MNFNGRVWVWPCCVPPKFCCVTSIFDIFEKCWSKPKNFMVRFFWGRSTFWHFERGDLVTQPKIFGSFFQGPLAIFSDPKTVCQRRASIRVVQHKSTRSLWWLGWRSKNRICHFGDWVGGATTKHVTLVVRLADWPWISRVGFGFDLVAYPKNSVA